MTKEQLLAEVEDLLRTMPPSSTIRHETEENMSWLGRLSAVIQQWNPVEGGFLRMYLSNFRQPGGNYDTGAFAKIVTQLHQARHDLRMATVGPTNIALPQGMVFHYFDEIRKIIELAKSEVFFVDPYLDAGFVSRYLPHVGTGVTIRLLAWKYLPTLLPSVDAFVQQSKATVEVRSAQDFHDRYIIVDKSSCYQSGASFKDGAKSAPTTLTQITDAFAAVLATYEDKWSRAKVER